MSELLFLWRFFTCPRNYNNDNKLFLFCSCDYYNDNKMIFSNSPFRQTPHENSKDSQTYIHLQDLSHTILSGDHRRASQTISGRMKKPLLHNVLKSVLVHLGWSYCNLSQCYPQSTYSYSVDCPRLCLWGLCNCEWLRNYCNKLQYIVKLESEWIHITMWGLFVFIYISTD